MKLEDFKVGQIWETRNEKARGTIESIAGYKTDYPIKFYWDEPLPDFVASRPVKIGEDNNGWDIFRADGGLNIMREDPMPSEWDLVRLVEPKADIPQYHLETDRIIAEQEGVLTGDPFKRLEDRTTTVMIAYDFAKILAGRTNLDEETPQDLARESFDLAEAMIAEQIKRGYR